MKKKRNNKGFSLVELIVVMAIMAILAITLAPRLIQYVEKSKGASDQNVVNSIYNATKLALVDETYLSEFTTSSTPKSAEGIYAVDLNTFYNYSSGTLVVDTTATNKAFKEIASVIGNFKLKSKEADADSDIFILFDSVNDKVTVVLDYDAIPAFTTAATPLAGEISTMITNASYSVTQ